MAIPEPGRVRPTLASLTREAWRTAPPLLRKLALTLWGIGLVGMAASITADALGWWGDLGFTENLISEIVCSLVAWPLALLVLNRLSAYQLEESTRPELERRLQTARQRTLDAVLGLRQTITAITEQVTRSVERLVDSTRLSGTSLVDAAEAADAAANLGRLMDTMEWNLLDAFILPVRISGQSLEIALRESFRNADSSELFDEFNQLSVSLQSALSQLRRGMEKDQPMFAKLRTVPVAEATTHRLRNAAIAYMKSLMNLVKLCEEVEGFLLTAWE